MNLLPLPRRTPSSLVAIDPLTGNVGTQLTCISADTRLKPMDSRSLILLDSTGWAAQVSVSRSARTGCRRLWLSAFSKSYHRPRPACLNIAPERIAEVELPLQVQLPTYRPLEGFLFFIP
jgi:hypothetical protein